MRRAARETGSLVVVEDHAFEGGLGDAVSAAVGALAPVLRLAVRSGPRSASMRELLDAHGISRREVVDTVVSLTADFSSEADQALYVAVELGKGLVRDAPSEPRPQPWSHYSPRAVRRTARVCATRPGSTRSP